MDTIEELDELAHQHKYRGLIEPSKCNRCDNVASRTTPMGEILCNECYWEYLDEEDHDGTDD